MQESGDNSKAFGGTSHRKLRRWLHVTSLLGRIMKNLYLVDGEATLFFPVLARLLMLMTCIESTRLGSGVTNGNLHDAYVILDFEKQLFGTWLTFHCSVLPWPQRGPWATVEEKVLAAKTATRLTRTKTHIYIYIYITFGSGLPS